MIYCRQWREELCHIGISTQTKPETFHDIYHFYTLSHWFYTRHRRKGESVLTSSNNTIHVFHFSRGSACKPFVGGKPQTICKNKIVEASLPKPIVNFCLFITLFSCSDRHCGQRVVCGKSGIGLDIRLKQHRRVHW